MMNAAHKYGLRLEALVFSKTIQKAMPLWDHLHADRIRLGRLSVPSKLLTCLQSQHRARTVGDFLPLSAVLDDAAHRPRTNCKCQGCSALKRDVECANPHLCAMRARDMLNTLSNKWDPRRTQPEDYEEDAMRHLASENLDRELVPFDRRVTMHGDLGHAFRIFTSTDAASDAIIPMQINEDGTTTVAATDGSCLQNGERDAQTGIGVYVESNPSLNRSLRLPPHLVQSNQTGEMAAILTATMIVDTHTRLTQITDSQTCMEAVLKHRQRHEDEGYILQKNPVLTKATVAKLRMRRAHTLFRWVKGHSGHPGNEATDKLAADGAAKPNGDTLRLSVPSAFRLTGAKLQAMTQKLAYKAIRKREDLKVKPRPRTVANLERITSGIQAAFGVMLYDAAIWRSLRSKPSRGKPLSSCGWPSTMATCWVRIGCARTCQMNYKAEQCAPCVVNATP